MQESHGIPVKCPKCTAQYNAPILSFIDVERYPELRGALLSNQLNVGVCPNCQTRVQLEVPLVYHDPAAEFLAVYFPAQLNMPEMEKQRAIGQLTQSLMNSLPPEKRKGYFLSPRQFMNRQNLLDAVMGTMGVSQEELDRQRKKAKFLDQLLVMADDPKGLAMMIKGQDAVLDGEFFMILSELLRQAQSVGDEKRRDQLTSLRKRLFETTTTGKMLAKQEAAVASLAEVTSTEQMVEKMIAADPDVVEVLALAGRPLLDYTFFQTLSERIGGSSGPEKERLVQLRERLLKLTEEMDAAARQHVQEAAKLLQDILQSPNPRSAVHDHMDEIGDVFLSVLQANIQEAEKRGAKDALAALEAINDEIMAVAARSLPPEMQLLNALLAAPYPEGTRQLLLEEREQITPEFLAILDEFISGMDENEDPTAARMIKRLRDIKGQAALLA